MLLREELLEAKIAALEGGRPLTGPSARCSASAARCRSAFALAQTISMGFGSGD